jgi:hypothetical protein
MEILGCIFIIAFGSLGHFLFEWCGHRKAAGLFFAVNESTWEHIKLSIYPAFIWMIVEVAVRGFSENLVVAQAASMATMMLLIPGLFYGYTAITKKNWLIPDIMCFCVAVAIGMWVFHAIMDAAPVSVVLYVISIIWLVAVLVMYFRFSYNPPHNFLFRDPISGGFGPKGHDCHSHFHTH